MPKIRDDGNKRNPSQLLELPFQLSDGNALDFSMDFASHRIIPFLPVSVALTQPPCPPDLFHGGSTSGSSKRTSQNDSKEVRGI